MFKIFLGQVEILILFLVAACFLVLFCFFLFPVFPPQLRNSVSFESHLGSEEKCSEIRINAFSAGVCEGETDSEFRVAFLRNVKKAKL